MTKVSYQQRLLVHDTVKIVHSDGVGILAFLYDFEHTSMATHCFHLPYSSDIEGSGSSLLMAPLTHSSVDSFEGEGARGGMKSRTWG